MQKKFLYQLVLSLLAPVVLADFAAPAEWMLVNTNLVQQWQVQQEAVRSDDYLVLPGVVADRKKNEVRLLAESVGHRAGVTTEFLLIGPKSDRAYESAGVTLAAPGDIVRAIEHLGIKRGGGLGSKPFRFWAKGERMQVFQRRIDGEKPGKEENMLNWIHDQQSPNAKLGSSGFVFTGGKWDNNRCLTDTELPGAVISLYNEAVTLFDLPEQVDQGQVYGRLVLAETLPRGGLYEIIFRPLLPTDGKPRILPLTLAIGRGPAGGFRGRGSDKKGKELIVGDLAEIFQWLAQQAQAERDVFVTLELDETMSIAHSADVARAFAMVDGKGMKLDGKAEGLLYARAFLPLEKWREREGRIPQPYELHLERAADGEWKKRLVFIEEDWSVPGLDPGLKPHEYAFEKWEELPALVHKAGKGEEKIQLLFIFAPTDTLVKEFMPGVHALAQRFPLVYVFGQ